jgi:hypothetical protein
MFAMADRQEAVKSQGIVLQPWIITLLISFVVNFVGFAYTWGTVVTRIDALDARVQRIERQLDAAEKFRSPNNYVSPPLGGARGAQP